MEHGLSPNGLWQMLVSLDARNPKRRKGIKGRKGRLPDLPFAEETGNIWNLKATHPPVPLVHTMNNHEIVAHLLFDFLHRRCRNHELLCAQFRLLLLCFLSDIWETDAVLTKRAVFINKNKNRRIRSSAPKNCSES